jgi:DNA-binding response OmpR family regulator
MFRILVVGRHPEIMTQVTAALKEDGHHATAALTDEQAMNAVKETALNLVVIGGGVDIGLRERLRKEIQDRRSAAKIIEHFGPLAALLSKISQLKRDNTG